MAKKKFDLQFDTRKRKLWRKESGERGSVEYILVAELPEEKRILYASTIGSEELDRRYGKNSLDKIVFIAIKKESGKKQLQITWDDGKVFLLDEQEFVLLFVMEEETSGKELRDSVLIVNFPKRLGQGIFQIYFSKDQDDAGLKLFWLLKDMV